MAIGSDCAFLAIACYDEFARQPANLACFRPTTRWPRLDLTYRLTEFLPGIDAQAQLDAVDQAFAAWGAVSALNFARNDVAADIEISFVSSSHGDPFPFDGPGGNLAHAYFPGSPQPGAIHVDEIEAWAAPALAEGQFDLFTVALHEAGHALGLEHSLDASAVMAPAYPGPVAALTQGDVDAIQALYGSSDGSVRPMPVVPPAQCTAPGALTALGDPDSDGDGIPDTIEVLVLGTDPFRADTDGDATSDFVEVFELGTPPAVTGADADGDSLPDADESAIGTDPNNPDSDGDGLTDGEEVYYYGTSPLRPDTDDDGFRDPDDPYPTNPMFPLDCNENLVDDDEELASGEATDCNENGIPDACEVSGDCNVNGVPDLCDIGAGTSDDCNNNAVPDECETAAGTAADCNENGVPDECELQNDCNENGVPDDCDLADGFSLDCNQNGIPDECDIASGRARDCNRNQTPDLCDLSFGVARDCNFNFVPDSCDVELGLELDCNLNGVPDVCDISAGTSEDCNENLAPDECDLAQGVPLDCGSSPPIP